MSSHINRFTVQQIPFFADRVKCIVFLDSPRLYPLSYTVCGIKTNGFNLKWHSTLFSFHVVNLFINACTDINICFFYNVFLEWCEPDLWKSFITSLIQCLYPSKYKTSFSYRNCGSGTCTSVIICLTEF